jgi:hypothetical protein
MNLKFNKMETINNVFDQQIEKIIDSFPTIYSKDDVVMLVSGLRTQVLTEVSELKPTASITEEQFQEFAAAVKSSLDRALCDGSTEVYDAGSAEYSISYDNRIELECVDILTDNITDEVDNILLDQFQEHFGKFLINNPE